jgi:trk system potassium uptake protein TrkH
VLTKSEIKKKFKLNTTQYVAIGFLGVILLGAVFLMLPISTSEGNSTKFIDALFTATTSVCVTGLTAVSTANHWTIFGKIVILVLIQLGGLGVVACVTLLLVVAKRRITLNERIIIRESYGLDTMEGMVKLIKRIVKGTLIVEGIGAVLYSIKFVPEFGLLPGIWRAVFNAVSAFCNAGMDILGDTSLQNYQGSVIINFTTMTLIVLGGIGFTVWWDVIRVLGENRKKEVHNKHFFGKLSLHSKLALVTTAILIVSGGVLFILIEYHNPETFGNMTFGEKIMAALFQSVTTRTAGFFTVPQEHLTNASAMISIILMFIGGSPAGTAGGMKTTTIAMVILTTVAVVKGKEDTEIFNRKIAKENVRLGLAVVTLGFGVLLTSTIILSLVENAQILDILYELTSALGTVGLSRALTPTLSSFSKLVVIIVMYLGRIGPITLVAALAIKTDKTKGIELPEKKIMIG